MHSCESAVAQDSTRWSHLAPIIPSLLSCSFQHGELNEKQVCCFLLANLLQHLISLFYSFHHWDEKEEVKNQKSTRF